MLSSDGYGSGPGDVNPGMPDDLEREEQSQKYGDEPRDADLFKLDEKAAGEELVRRWSVQDPYYQRRIVEWKVNARRIAGDVNVWAVKTQDQNSWQVYPVPGSGTAPPPAVFNKQYRLCDRLSAIVFADDPKLEAESPPNDPKGSVRARLATAVLRDVDSEGRLNDLAASREAFGEWGPVTGSGYVHYFIDPHLGGRQPIAIEAAPNAISVDDATTDPMTGQPHADLVQRFVSADGSLTDDPSAAALRWMPGLTRDVLGAHHVRFEPHTATDIGDAEGVFVAAYYPWEQVLRWVPALGELAPEEKERLSRVRPKATNDLLPWKDGRPQDSPQQAKLRERMTFVLWVYYLECPQYPDGFSGVVVGDLCHKKSTWVAVQGGRSPYDLPVAQYKQFPAPDGNPHGWGLMHLLGPAGEWRAELVGAIEDVLDRIRNRKMFVPTTSNLQGKHWMMQALSIIPINEGGEPKYEEVPTDALKPAGELLAIATKEMDDASTLQEAAQGMDSSNVQSGKHAMAVQSMVGAAQSGLRQNCATAMTRAGRIKLQLIRGIATAPQLVKYGAGDDAMEQYTAADLKGITNVRLVPGSFSGMTPMQKAERAMMFGQAGLVPPDELAEVVQGAIGNSFGWLDSPHAKRVRSQVAKWEKAVRELGPEAAMVPVQSQVQPGPMGEPIETPMADPAAAAFFAPRLVDQEPRVAAIRAKVLGNAMVEDAYEMAPPGWRLALDQAYQAAVGVMQQQGMAAQQAAQGPPDEGDDEGQEPNLKVA